MVKMLHEVRVNATPAKVFAALTTSEGLRAWWTGDSVAEPRVGSIAIFGFSNRATVFRMRVSELVANERVGWECLGDAEEWRGTKLAWDITPEKKKAATVRLVHGGWKNTEGWYAVCNTTWGALMHRLRDHLEGHAPGPIFKGFI